MSTVAKQPAIYVPDDQPGSEERLSKVLELSRLGTSDDKAIASPNMAIINQQEDISNMEQKTIMFRSLIVWTFEYFFVHPTKR
jgi:hypothetical protein